MAISLIDALGITEEKSRPFAIRFVTFDASRKKGGQIIDLSNAVRVGTSHNQKDNDTITVKQLNNSHHPHTVHTHLILSVNNNQIFI